MVGVDQPILSEALVSLVEDHQAVMVGRAAMSSSYRTLHLTRSDIYQELLGLIEVLLVEEICGLGRPARII
jgi:hypothetical protein